MKAMILAAGFGTRLRPLTERIPKPLLPVGGTPLIVWNVLLLRAAGIHEVMINLHYLGGLIEDTLGDGSHWDMEVSYSHEPEILGTGGGLKAAEGFFEEQPCLVMNGDTLIDIDLKALMQFHEQRQGVATLVVRNDPHADQWGLVECDKHHRILRINGQGVSKYPRVEPVYGRMFAGVHIFHPAILQQKATGSSFSIIEVYTHQLAHGSSIFGFIHDGYWSDVGTVERYTQAQQDVADGLLTLASRSSPKYT